MEKSCRKHLCDWLFNEITIYYGILYPLHCFRQQVLDKTIVFTEIDNCDNFNVHRTFFNIYTVYKYLKAVKDHSNYILYDPQLHAILPLLLSSTVEDLQIHKKKA